MEERSCWREHRGGGSGHRIWVVVGDRKEAKRIGKIGLGQGDLGQTQATASVKPMSVELSVPRCSQNVKDPIE